MGKYEGADGWLYDDSVDGPSRYQASENVQKPAPKKDPPRKLNSCPNCSLGFSWRREEGYCTSCGWGKPKKPKSKDDGGACCAFLATAIGIPLVSMGMGYGAGGFGGLLVGLGLGCAVPIVVLVLAAASPKKKK
ncbi:hypothetical protein LCGC14_0663320 [marine sediment metagenome]|uniref:Uncharacterized protein n=1 Tax=marine sediment metagenome TaxID=412755 RepID=A0A0F9QY46_9ZZZZ